MKIFRIKSLFSYIKKDFIEEIVEITDELKEKIRKIQLSMLKELCDFCNKNNIEIMLGGGTFLGAVRHQGFIPWDDDLDLMIRREEFEKLLKIIDCFSEKYEFQYSRSQNSSYLTFAKLMYKKSKYIEIGSENIPKLNGVFIDIFVIENTPNNFIQSFFYGIKCNYMQLISSCILFYKYRSKYNEIILKSTVLGKINYYLRYFLGYMYRKVDIKLYLQKVDKVYGKYKKIKEAKYLTIPTGRGHYFGEKQPQEIFKELKLYKFENLKILGPKNYDAYLKKLYGNDYMEIPSIEKRERHYSIEVFIDED